MDVEAVPVVPPSLVPPPRPSRWAHCPCKCRRNQPQHGDAAQPFSTRPVNQKMRSQSLVLEVVLYVGAAFGTLVFRRLATGSQPASGQASNPDFPRSTFRKWLFFLTSLYVFFFFCRRMVAESKSTPSRAPLGSRTNPEPERDFFSELSRAPVKLVRRLRGEEDSMDRAGPSPRREARSCVRADHPHLPNAQHNAGARIRHKSLTKGDRNNKKTEDGPCPGEISFQIPPPNKPSGGPSMIPGCDGPGPRRAAVRENTRSRSERVERDDGFPRPRPQTGNVPSRHKQQPGNEFVSPKAVSTGVARTPASRSTAGRPHVAVIAPIRRAQRS